MRIGKSNGPVDVEQRWKRGTVPIRPAAGDAAQLVQGLAGEIADGIGIAFWSGWSTVPAPLRMPCQGIPALGKRIDGRALGA
jgi:hypothetical protein